MNLDTFEERNKHGQEAVLFITQILKNNNIEWGYIVSPEEWDNVVYHSPEWHILRNKDEKYGDIWIKHLTNTVEIKRGPIALQTIEKSNASVFLICSPDLSDCRILYPEVFNNINKHNCHKLKSGYLGFSFDQIKILKYISFEEFLKTI